MTTPPTITTKPKRKKGTLLTGLSNTNEERASVARQRAQVKATGSLQDKRALKSKIAQQHPGLGRRTKGKLLRGSAS